VALFRRKTDELLMPHVVVFVPSWARRLCAVGDAMDRTGSQFRDVVVVTEGGPEETGAMITVLHHQQNLYRAGWTSAMYRIEADAEDLTAGSAESAPQTALPAGHRQSHGSKLDPHLWSTRLGAIGVLIDDQAEVVRSVTVIVLDSGAVVNGLVPAHTSATGWVLHSFEFPEEQIRSVAPAPAPQTPQHSRAWKR
jgi:hypothetical protein